MKLEAVDGTGFVAYGLDLGRCRFRQESESYGHFFEGLTVRLGHFDSVGKPVENGMIAYDFDFFEILDRLTQIGNLGPVSCPNELVSEAYS